MRKQKQYGVRFDLVAATCIFLCVLGGCGIIPSIPAYTSVNEARPSLPTTGRDIRAGSQVLRAEYGPFGKAEGRPASTSTFVGVAISGGGSRAATFSTAVLHELDRFGFLSHVNAISSVSGGSLPAAYFALNGDEIRTDHDWEKAHTLMRTPFRSNWLWRYLRPDNLLLNLTTDYDRSDAMAEVFDDVLFKNKTFGDLGRGGKRRPNLLVNATQLGLSEPRQFTFTGTNFIAYVDSKLESFPISRAVMASAAFPGVFNAITLKNHVRHPTPGKQFLQTYVHLIDGGPSDNLGVETILAAARAHRGDSPKSAFSCFIFVVDAYPPNAGASMLLKRDLRSGPIDYVVDSNFLDAFDGLLARRRESTLRELGFQLEIRGTADHPLSDRAWPGRTTSISKGFYAGEEGLSRYVHPYDRVLSVPLGTSKAAQALESASCQIWHIAMSEVASLMYSSEEVPLVAGPLGEARHPALVYRQRLWHLTSRIGTDFNLGGPPKCDAEKLQRALRDSAYIITNEDDDARAKACTWFKAAFPKETFSCGDRKAPLRQSGVELIVVGARPNISLECVN